MAGTEWSFEGVLGDVAGSPERVFAADAAASSVALVPKGSEQGGRNVAGCDK